VMVTQCEVPLTPVMMFPYEESVPYSTTVVRVDVVVQVMVTEEPLIVTVTLDISAEPVVNDPSALQSTFVSLVKDMDLTLKWYAVAANSPVRVTECDVPFVPVAVLPYDEVLP